MSLLKIFVRKWCSYWIDDESRDDFFIRRRILIVFSILVPISTIIEIYKDAFRDTEALPRAHYINYFIFIFISWVLTPVCIFLFHSYKLAVFLFCGWMAYGIGVVEMNQPHLYFSAANALLVVIPVFHFLLTDLIDCTLFLCLIFCLYSNGTESYLQQHASDEEFVITRSSFELAISQTKRRFISTLIILVLQTYITSRGIKRLKQMKDETERVSKEREIFFASMSHELRNPLNALLGCIELLKDSNEVVREALLETAQVCSETLLNLIGNILDVSKIRNNKFELLTSSVDLKDSMTKIMNMMKSLAESKGIYLKMKFGKKFPYFVEYDSTKFNQVLINIISNAIKFTERGGVFVNVSWTPILNNQIPGREDPLFRILLGSSSRKRIIESVDERESDDEGINSKQLEKYEQVFNLKKKNPFRGRARSFINREERKIERQVLRTISSSVFEDEVINRHGYLKVEVIDTGFGINLPNIKKLFQPFVQTHSNSSFGGTGLGLWIAKNIINFMGGDIQIESKIGNGTNFIIVVTLKVTEEEKIEELKSQNHGNFRGMRCLLVEDMKANQAMMNQMLKREHISVYIAKNGHEGFNLFKTKEYNYFDFIITDLRMPVMSGQVMINKIREYEKSLHIPKPIGIIVTTGDPSENEKLSCLNIGANDFLSKPIRMKQLSESMKKLFCSPKIEKEMKGLSEMTILVIDDDSFSSDIVKRFLTNKYHILQAFTSQQGLELYQAAYSKICLIILDSQIGQVTGVSLAKSIRTFEHRIQNQVPIISISGNSIPKQKADYAEIAISEFLMKPITKKRLILSLKKTLNIQ